MGDDVAMTSPASDDVGTSASSPSSPLAKATDDNKYRDEEEEAGTENRDAGEPVDEEGEHDADAAEETSSPTQIQAPLTEHTPPSEIQSKPAAGDVVDITFFTTSKIPRTHQQNKPTKVQVRKADIALDVVRRLFPNTAELQTETDYKQWIHSEGRKMGNKRETGVIATLRNWHLYPHPDDDASNVETSLQMISRNSTVVRKSIIVYCAWREFCIGVLDVDRCHSHTLTMSTWP